MAEMDLKQHNVLEELSEYFPPGTTEEEIAEIYNNPELFQRYMQELQTYYGEMQHNYSVYEECAIPVVTQSVNQMWQILFYCLIIRCLCKFRLNHSLIHCVSIVFGLMTMWKFYGNDMVYTVLPSVLFIPFFQARGIYKGLVICILTAVYLVACEFLLLDAIKWNKVKGSVMIVLMKVISVVFDFENQIVEVPSNLIEFYGYIFNPASIIFGPFIKYKDYMQILKAHSLNLAWFLNCLRSIMLSVICLLWSSCGISNYLPILSSYIPVLEENKWWRAYQDAQIFRFSHYFICYFSESSCLFSGIATMDIDDTSRKKQDSEKNSDAEDEKEKREVPHGQNTGITWSFPVANIIPVELPGSLVDVVTNWNLPMHYWLKNYIYKSTRTYGIFVAILATYIASSILHGMNCQLSAVLLSIGTFAYVEGVTRHVFASIFSACIEARPCKSNCGHIHQRKTFWVMAINLFFSFVAVWNLAYLGCVFDNSNEEEAGYSWTHLHNKWQKYNYLNHLVMLVVFIIQSIVNTGRLF